MCLLLITQSFNMCSITNRCLKKSLKIMNLAAILDLKIFTNVINDYLDHHYVSGYFKNAFWSLYLKLYEKFHIFNVVHFGLQIMALMGKMLGVS